MKLIKTIILTFLLALSISAFSADKININTADKETLITAIDGVGEKKAEAIIAYREENGGFKSVNDLVNVKGIGQGIVERHREALSVSD